MQSAKLFLQSSDLGLPQPLTRRRVCPPSPGSGGRGTLAGERARSVRDLLPLSRQQEVVSLSKSSFVSPIELSDGIEGEGVGEEPNHTIARIGRLVIIQYSEKVAVINKCILIISVFYSFDGQAI
jgi:hypothetical protein